MTDKPENTPTDAATKAQSIGRWENEGGTAPPPSPATRKPPKRPRDPNQLAKMIVDIATGETGDTFAASSPMSELGRTGGIKGGKARAAALPPERRREIAQKAAATRWAKKAK